jgi:hypothetical protein
MADKKMRLTESELKQVVEASVRQILMKEGFFKKAGDAIDRFENWADEKMEDFERGYDLKEGNPTSVFDVIEGNGWEPVENKKKPISDGQNYMGVKKVTGTWGIHNGLSIDELIEDINIFLDGRGHASHVQNVNGYSEVIAVDAPANLIKGNGMNESIYGNDGFESTSTMDVNRQPQRSLKDEIDMVHDLWWMIEDKGEHDEDGHHIFLSPGIVYNGDELDVIHTMDGPNYPLWVFGTLSNRGHYDFNELPYNIQQQIFNDVNEYEEEYDDDNELYESFNMGGNDMVKFYLNSPMNGRQVITVPFEEFANAQYKNDYLWEKAAEQGNIKLMRNGYFEVDPNDPHKAEVDRIF